MTKFWKITNTIVLGLLILICGLGTFYKHISFGLGLGDMFGYLVLYLGTLIHLILTLISRKKGSLRHTFLTLTSEREGIEPSEILYFTVVMSF